MKLRQLVLCGRGCDGDARLVTLSVSK